MKASDLLVRCLEREGITHVFGVPGEENADFMMSLEKTDITFVLTRHEQGAAFMAEVYGRLTGDPAVCLGTLGPGATNLTTGIADANMDHAPVIVLTGQAAVTRQHKESHQVMNVVDMFRSITKWTCPIQHPDTIPEIVRKAVRLARAEKPGAVHIELPEDVAKETTDKTPLTPRRFRRPVPDETVIAEAWRMISDAKSPIIIAGNGAIRKRASAQLRRFCDQTGIGVLSTFMAKGCVDMDAEYCLYTIGLQQEDYATLAVQKADLVITIGYDLVEYPPQVWNPDRDDRILHLDFDPAEIDEHYMPELEVIGDLGHALERLCKRAGQAGPSDFDLKAQREVRSRMAEEISAHANDTGKGPIKPQKALWDARQVLPADGLLLSGVGAHKMWIGRQYQCHEPNTCLIPNGFCSMGMPLPGAIAASLLDPNRKILGIAGDADFLMNLQEMETARRLNAQMTIMIWVDNAYGLIEWKQEQEFGRHTDLDFDNPDWEGLARSFGWAGFYTDDAGALSAMLTQALNTPGPSLVAIPIDYTENMKLSERLGDLELTL